MAKNGCDRDKGFYVNEDFKINSVAYLSLGIALKAYASTFRDIEFRLHLFCDNKEESSNNAKYGGGYIEHFCEAITHFQHFAELYIKEILQKKHTLLVADAGRDHVLLYELLMDGVYDESKVDSLKQIEFSVALNRICELIKNEKIDDKYKFISDFQNELREVNKLRNRIAHRGIYVLHYEKLDELFGKFLLPFIDKVLNVESKNKEYYFKKTRNGLNPYIEIIEHLKGSYDLKTVGVLKEIARATYEDKISTSPFFKSFHEHKIKNIEANADFIEKDTCGRIEVEACPVCGFKTLLLDWTNDSDMDEKGNCTYVVHYVYDIKCINCTFELHHNTDDVKIKNLDLTKYFKER